MSEFKSGFAALIGASNVGKSTMLNRLLGQKVAITSRRPQTTRNRIAGIYTSKAMQVILLDTPGLFTPKSKLDRYMKRASFSSLKDVDVILLMVEPKMPGPGEREIISQLKRRSKPVFLLINKIDLIHPDNLLPIIAAYRKLFPFKEYLPVSAKQGNGVPDLLGCLENILPAGPKYYDSDQITDRPEYFVVAELIREEILRLTWQEVPHASCVIVDSMHEHRGGKLQIHATIYTEKEGQKGIIIGKKARMIKQIGINARKQIELLLGAAVNLRLLVKVHPKWRQDTAFLKRAGYDEKDLS